MHFGSKLPYSSRRVYLPAGNFCNRAENRRPGNRQHVPKKTFARTPDTKSGSLQKQASCGGALTSLGLGGAACFPN